MILKPIVIAYCAAAAVGIGGAFLAYAAAATPPSYRKRLGLRGLKRERALESNELWAMIEPLVRWLGERLTAFITDSWRAELNERIGLAGDFLGLMAEELVALSAMLFA